MRSKGHKKSHRPSIDDDDDDIASRKASQGPQEEGCEFCDNRHAGGSPGATGDGEQWLQARLDLTNATSFHRRNHLVASFFCRCTQVYAHIHQALARFEKQQATDLFTEEVVREVGQQLLPLFPLFHQHTRRQHPQQHAKKRHHHHHHHHRQSRHHSNPPAALADAGCPFVMLISVMLPSLRKYLAWTVRSRSNWGWQQNIESASRSSSSVKSSVVIGPMVARSMIGTLMAQHDIVSKVAMECDQIAFIIETNEEMDHDEHMSTSAFPPDTHMQRAPQIKKVSLEFEEVLAEYKIQLGELSEVILETTEALASRLCRPITSKESTKARNGSAMEFIEMLIQQILDPIVERVTSAPSQSYLYLFHRIVEKCVSVAIDEFVLDNVKMNDILAAQFEKAIVHLKSWCTRVESEFARAHAARTDKRAEDSAGDEALFVLNLLGLDSIKRLDLIQHAWLRSGKMDESILAKVRKANLESLRNTFARSISARPNFTGSPGTVQGPQGPPGAVTPTNSGPI